MLSFQPGTVPKKFNLRFANLSLYKIFSKVSISSSWGKSLTVKEVLFLEKMTFDFVRVRKGLFHLLFLLVFDCVFGLMIKTNCFHVFWVVFLYDALF